MHARSRSPARTLSCRASRSPSLVPSTLLQIRALALPLSLRHQALGEEADRAARVDFIRVRDDDHIVGQQAQLEKPYEGRRAERRKWDNTYMGVKG